MIILLNGALYFALSISGVNMLNPLFASLFFLGIAIRIENLSPNLFYSFRNYTYQIFLMGIFPQIFVKILYTSFTFQIPVFIVYALCILSGLYLPVIFSSVIKKTNLSLLKKMCGL
jgi:hypothetical protein